MFDFSISATCGGARTGTFTTPHGSFRTPAFMPVGTYGAVKTLSPQELRSVGAEIVLSNTYHLDNRPGAEAIEQLGGIHRFMAYDGPILTDSGGFQVYSLGNNVQITDEHVEFSSPVDGDRKRYSPEDIVHTQAKLRVDIAMQLDDAAPAGHARAKAEQALRRTVAWAKRSVEAAKPYASRMALFPIVQGGKFPDLRKEAAGALVPLDTPGLAIGGLVGGETKAQYLEILETTLPLLPKIRYVMGIGDSRDIVQAVVRGADMFDCVLPTRLARHGTFFVDEWGTKAHIKHAKFKMDTAPLSEDTPIECRGFSRAYVRHLYMQNESLGLRILTLHNLSFMFRLMRRLQDAIAAGALAELAAGFAFAEEELTLLHRTGSYNADEAVSAE